MSYVSFTPKLSNYNDYTVDNYFDNVFTSLYSLLNTPKGSHPYDPDFGVDLRNMIFRNDAGNLTLEIESSVKTSIRKYLPEVYPLTGVLCTRELHSSGFGYKYSLVIAIENVLVKFGISKEGRVMYTGIRA